MSNIGENLLNNKTIELLQSHRSTRKFTDEPITEEMLEEIFEAAQWAPSSHNMQAYSIIVIRNEQTKEKLSHWCGDQVYVKKCPVFLVFCLDFYRLKKAADMNESVIKKDEIENLLVGAVDTALAAQNSFIAARSLGLGGVMIGGIRNHPEEVSDLLELPPLTIPIMGLCLGFPDQHVWQKPRLPRSVVVHKESYNTDIIKDGLVEYEARSADYYTRRTKGARTDGWTKQMAAYVKNPRRPHLKKYIQSQGFKIT